jgi:Rrf2 family transcriptional regulator, nitric oxide-sensitive transcriptional repressor
MLSQTVEYALRTCVHLALHAPASRTTDEVADSTRVPRAYLSKIIQSLARAELVNTQRGVGGGINLSQKPSDINLLQVINAVEPFARIKECPLGLPMHGTQLCALHRRLDHALAHFESAFGKTTLAELIHEQTMPAPLCILPIRKRA